MRYLLVLSLLAVVSPSVPAASDDRERGPRETASLDGPWRIVLDQQNVGKSQSWHDPDVLAKQASVPIHVPSCWEETQADYEGVAWYARTLTVPEAWKGRHVRLEFDAVNYLADVWLNDEVVGDHEGGYTPFEFDVTELVDHGGENVLIVRVVGPAIREERVDVLVRNEAPHWRGAYVGGIWQSVRLVATHPTFVRDVFVEPKLREKTAVVHVELANTGIRTADAEVNVSIRPAARPDELVAERTVPASIPPSGHVLATTLPIDDPVPWSPDNPHLYLARVTITSGKELVDARAARFGMREFTIREGDFYLNGERVFIKGAFWEGVYPGTLAYPRDSEIVRKEIRMAQQAGFNLLRPWRHPTPPVICDLADEMGILLIASPAIECMGYWPAETPPMERRWTYEMQSLVRRDRNHPSIICWETSNEILRRSMLRMRHRVSLAARRLDPTRLVIDESGGSRAPWGAHAYLPYSSEPIPIVDRHIYRRSPVNDADYRHLATYGEADKLTFISEVGYGGLPDLEANVARYKEEGNRNTPDYRYHQELLASLEEVLDKHDLRGLFPTVTVLCEETQLIQAVGNMLQLEALRVNPRADGYCLHAFTAGDWVLGAGVLDIWREPKKMYFAAQEVQAPLYLAVRVTPHNVYADRRARLTVTAVNDGPAREIALDATVSADPGPRGFWKTEAKVRLDRGIHQLVDERLDLGDVRGLCTVHTSAEAESSSAVGSFDFLVFDRAALEPAVSHVTVIEPKGRLRTFCQGCGIEYHAFQDGRQVKGPVVVAQPDAWNEKQLVRFVHLIDWIERGGVAVWLKVPSTYEWHGQPIYRDYEKNYMLRLQQPNRPQRDWPNWLIESGVFPLELRHRNARGMWIPVLHYMRPHPIFEALPAGSSMGQPYQNVAPANTLVNLPGPTVAGSISWDVEHDCYAKMQAWHGTDLAVVPHGKGKMILSMLQIVDHLGSDPVADKLFQNLLGHAAEIAGEVAPPSADFDKEVQTALEQYRQLRGEAASDGK